MAGISFLRDLFLCFLVRSALFAGIAKLFQFDFSLN